MSYGPICSITDRQTFLPYLWRVRCFGAVLQLPNVVIHRLPREESLAFPTHASGCIPAISPFRQHSILVSILRGVVVPAKQYLTGPTRRGILTPSCFP